MIRGLVRRAGLSALGAAVVAALTACPAGDGASGGPAGDTSGADSARGVDRVVVPDSVPPSDTSVDSALSVDAADGFDTDAIADSAGDALHAADTRPPADTAPQTPCPAAALGTQLGVEHLLIGGAMDDAAFDAAPFDLRYRYIAGDIPDGGPCESCATDCQVAGSPCANGGPGCAWWGCWQWDQRPPGRYVVDHALDTPTIPMITYYTWFSVAGRVESTPEIAALQDATRVANYLADFRFLCRRLAEGARPALLHLEPDLWGFVHRESADPATVPVALASAGAAECAGLPDTAGGLARCMVAIARSEAPMVAVGLHASAWGDGHDALINGDASFDVVAHARRTAAFMNKLGAAETDFVVVEMSDRDAGYNGRWWDATDAQRPHFQQAIAWAGALADGIGLPPLWWQVPYGHGGLDNRCGRYQDNRVDYVFDHVSELAAAGALGVAFGAGAECMTTPSSDDGHFVERAQAYYSVARPRLCGAPEPTLAGDGAP